jgi:hypothetical protein
MNDLDSAFGNLLPNRDPERDSNQVGVFELDPGAFVAVVQ